jgi:hypothetical protein
MKKDSGHESRAGATRAGPSRPCLSGMLTIEKILAEIDTRGLPAGVACIGAAGRSAHPYQPFWEKCEVMFVSFLGVMLVTLVVFFGVYLIARATLGQ